MNTDSSCAGMNSIQPLKNPGFLDSHVSARTMNDIITIISANLHAHMDFNVEAMDCFLDGCADGRRVQFLKCRLCCTCCTAPRDLVLPACFMWATIFLSFFIDGRGPAYLWTSAPSALTIRLHGQVSTTCCDVKKLWVW